MSHALLSDDIKKKYSSFIRKDLRKINKWKLVVGAIYLLPFRVLGFITCYFFYANLMRVISIIFWCDPSKPYPSKIRSFFKYTNYYVGRVILFFMAGFINI